MALDPIVLNPGVGGDSVGADNIGGVNYEVVKQAFGAPGSLTLVDPSNPLPVTDAVAEAALTSLAAEDFATHAAQTDGSQKSQIVDAGGNAVTVTGNKLDVNATFSGDIEIGAVELKNGTDDTRATVTPANALKVDGSAVTQPISAAALPLPAGAAIAANQQTDALTNTQLRASPVPISGTVAVDTSLLATAAKQDVGNASLAAIDAGIPAALGQATMANSMPVTIASNQSAIPVTFSGLATDNTQLYSNTIVATGAITGIDTTGYESVVFQFSGSWVGNLIIEGSNDNSTWEQIILLDVNENSIQDVVNENGVYVLKTTTKYIRLNVQQLAQGSIIALVLGRTVTGIDGADRIALAMDRNNNMPLYVAEIETKKDISKALIPSDAPAPIYGFAQATNAVIFNVDTTGYQSVVVQSVTLGSAITMQTSNDGVTWVGLAGYNTTGVAVPISSIVATGVYAFPAIGRFVRGLMGGASFTNAFVYLRQQPVTSNVASQNLAFINGTAPVTAGVAGTLAVGGPVGNGVAPSSNNPIQIGGTDINGLIRRIITDASGRVITAGVVDQLGTTRQPGALTAASNQFNIAAAAVMDVSSFEGQSMMDLLAQILLELRINNQMMSELPLVLQGQNGRFDEPSQFRQEQSLFAI